MIAITTTVGTATLSLPLVILLAPPESDPKIVAVANEVGFSFASVNGMLFEQRTSLPLNEMPSSLANLIVLAPDPGVLALASAAPQVQVIAVGVSPGEKLSNLVTIAVGESSSAQVAFIAGYVAAMSAEEWRAGMLYTTTSAMNVNDFSAGAEYFCGSCTPISPPFVEYPVSAQATDPQNWQSAVDQLISQQVKVVYLSPEMEKSPAVQYLSDFGVLLIGNNAPNPESVNSWIVSIEAPSLDTLRESITAALNNQPVSSNSSLILANPSPEFFSVSRQVNVQRVIDDLINGYITLPLD
jgi:hypothetical protein